MWLRAQAQLEGAQAQHVQARTRRISALEKELFGASGNPADAISLRDAQDRAAALTDEQAAAALLARAERSGDTHLARAVAEVATDRGWYGPLNAWLDARPGFEPKAQ